MNNDAESVLAALESYFRSALRPPFETISRRVKLLSEITKQPALFILHKDTEDTWQQQMQRSTLGLIIRVSTTHGPTEIPSTKMNALLLALRNSLAPDNKQTNTFTIGGAAYWCRIDGTTEIYPGDTTDSSVAYVPMKILLP
jgi:hypothetical protein